MARLNLFCFSHFSAFQELKLNDNDGNFNFFCYLPHGVCDQTSTTNIDKNTFSLHPNP